ncbi:hypothetical protein SDC9_175379 [bioreactor metagenome]|uniref:Uncharacterized protein n=1 Tax=bioreactor metagenome TaxID=1076179 RepID=A0A645GMJ4_9ZZZZ
MKSAPKAQKTEGAAVDEDHAGEGQGRRDAQVLGGRGEAQNPAEVGEDEIKGHRAQPGRERTPVTADIFLGEAVHKIHRHLHNALYPPRMVGLQLPRGQKHGDHDNRHQNPGHQDRLGHGDAAECGDGECGLIFKLRRQGCLNIRQ